MSFKLQMDELGVSDSDYARHSSHASQSGISNLIPNAGRRILASQRGPTRRAASHIQKEVLHCDPHINWETDHLPAPACRCGMSLCHASLPPSRNVSLYQSKLNSPKLITRVPQSSNSTKRHVPPLPLHFRTTTVSTHSISHLPHSPFRTMRINF